MADPFASAITGIGGVFGSRANPVAKQGLAGIGAGAPRKPTQTILPGSAFTSFLNQKRGIASEVAAPFQTGRITNPVRGGRGDWTGGRGKLARYNYGSPFGPTSQLGRYEPTMSLFERNAQARIAKRDAAMAGSSLGAPYGGGGNGSVAQDPGFGQFGQDPSVYNEIAQAAAKEGIPANLLQAVIARESSGDWASNSHSVASVRGGKPIFGYVGVFHDAARSWGFDPASLEGNRAGQIAMLARGLRQFYDQSPGHDWAQAVSMHFSGNWQPSGYVDELGNGDASYVNQVLEWWKELDAQTGYAAPGTAQGGQGVTGNAKAVIDEALRWVGQVPYVWGGIPGKGQTPYADGGGWDCSGFTYWLDQNLGSGTLVMGSHHQYAQAQQDGTFIRDMSQLQPGDLIFFDTGNSAGGGAELNRAGHVGMYIGNGQFVHAANPTDGTLVSNLAGHYAGQFIGGKRMGWSGGSPTGTGSYGSGTLGYGGGGYGGANWFHNPLDLILGRAA
ncbi:MAG TPA: C40 family peptidase [Kofleriaceae bacterium]|nr:C40 family peptidase [Kofleriaceae bacterium]